MKTRLGVLEVSLRQDHVRGNFDKGDSKAPTSLARGKKDQHSVTTYGVSDEFLWGLRGLKVGDT